MREAKTQTAQLLIPGLSRVFTLTDEDRFPWTLPPTWNGTEKRPALVQRVHIGPVWGRHTVTVIFEAHVLRKNGEPGVKAVSYTLDGHDWSTEAMPQWVKDAHHDAVRHLTALEDAVDEVNAEYGLKTDV